VSRYLNRHGISYFKGRVYQEHLLLQDDQKFMNRYKGNKKHSFLPAVYSLHTGLVGLTETLRLQSWQPYSGRRWGHIGLIKIWAMLTGKSRISLAYAEGVDSLPISGASSIPLCYIPFPSTLSHQQVFLHPSLHLVIYFLVYLSALFPNSHMTLFWEFYCLPFSVHAQTSVIYLTLLFLLW